MTALGYVVIFLVLGAAAFVILWNERQKQKFLHHLDEMLDRAISEGFTEEDYDESLLSAVESKLARYLAASTVSARNLQREKDTIKTLIADISHQTKTPLANILLYSELLSEKSLDEESQHCVTALKHQAEKLQSLIEALVKTSRLESGVLAMHPKPSPLFPVLKDAVSQFLPKAGEKDIELTLASSDREGIFDPKWTAEAVCNLLDNAIKYTPPGGRVTVSTASFDLFCRIAVTDTGIGIPEEEQAKIFQRFYRRTVNQEVQGVGIGLHLVRQIAGGQGGYVKVSSKEGEGSTFSLYLPKP